MLTLAANTDMMAVMKGMTDPVSSIVANLANSANSKDVKIKSGKKFV